MRSYGRTAYLAFSLVCAAALQQPSPAELRRSSHGSPFSPFSSRRPTVLTRRHAGEFSSPPPPTTPPPKGPPMRSRSDEQDANNNNNNNRANRISPELSVLCQAQFELLADTLQASRCVLYFRRENLSTGALEFAPVAVRVPSRRSAHDCARAHDHTLAAGTDHAACDLASVSNEHLSPFEWRWWWWSGEEDGSRCEETPVPSGVWHGEAVGLWCPGGCKLFEGRSSHSLTGSRAELGGCRVARSLHLVQLAVGHPGDGGRRAVSPLSMIFVMDHQNSQNGLGAEQVGVSTLTKAVSCRTITKRPTSTRRLSTPTRAHNLGGGPFDSTYPQFS